MTPSQPGRDNTADRRDRPDRQTDEESNLTILAQPPHIDALSHFVDCVICRRWLFTTVADALATTTELHELLAILDAT